MGDDADDSVVLRRLLGEAGIRGELVFTDGGRPTTVKDRFLGRAANREPHHALRVDSESRGPIGTEVGKRFVDGVMRGIGGFEAVLISDYAKGICTPWLLAAVLAAAGRDGVPNRRRPPHAAPTVTNRIAVLG